MVVTLRSRPRTPEAADRSAAGLRKGGVSFVAKQTAKVVASLLALCASLFP